MDYPQQAAPGASLEGTTATELSASITTNRNCTIEITNNLGVPLTDPQSHCNSGYAYTPLQPTIQPWTREAASFSKASEAVRGAVGVFTYRIEGSGLRLAVMFSVPYDYNLSSNWFAVGFVSQDVETNDALYQDMYYGEGWKDGMDRKREKASHGGTLHVESSDQNLFVDATMSDAKRAIIKLNISGGQQGGYMGGQPGYGGGQPNYMGGQPEVYFDDQPQPHHHHRHHHHGGDQNW